MIVLLNVITHIFGFFLGLLAIIASIVKNIREKFFSVPLAIYGICCMFLYLSSVLYHIDFKNKIKEFFKKLDHSSIFLMISGTYTCLVQSTIKNVTSILVIIGVWVGSIVGIILNMIDVRKFSKFSLFLYLILGWSALIIFKPIIQSLDFTKILWLAIGGLSYTIGVVFYTLGKKWEWCHVIWHLFVLFGSISHFFIFI